MTMPRRRRRTAKEIARAKAKAVNARRHHLLHVHHMTMIEYEELLSFQNGVCYLCQHPPGIGKNLHIDHDHALAKQFCDHPHQESCSRCWRGLVHRHCNDALACARDEVMFFHRAIDYLQNPPARRWQVRGVG